MYEVASLERRAFTLSRNDGSEVRDHLRFFSRSFNISGPVIH